ncbi:methyltransferase [Brevibacillus fluminis]|uniref:Methyltransferase n=1 Tax=Brevibacillus fluminis TaxID=511487 RepID=A0A3M8CWH9_9BACL|nr:methyltransferase [Brevibacillus fluminis]RNB80160.1 methyltransferase [Brevibacillus fluminis]
MKKPFVYACVLLMFSLAVLAACAIQKDETKSIAYDNPTHHFTLSLPLSWEGKYDIVESESKVSFVSKANIQAGGELFSISIWTKEKWATEGEELAAIIHLAKIGEDQTKVFTFATPTDVQYLPDDEQKKAEYANMASELEGIKATFALQKE